MYKLKNLIQGAIKQLKKEYTHTLATPTKLTFMKHKKYITIYTIN